MRNIRKKKMRARNRKPQKNRRSQSQTAKKQKSEEGKSARQRNPNTPIRNEFDVSPQVFWAECSDKRLSAQYLRPNIQPIYHPKAKLTDNLAPEIVSIKIEKFPARNRLKR